MLCLVFKVRRKLQLHTSSVVPVIILCLALFSVLPAVADEAKAWQLLSEGKAVLLMRHALAPGVGDPPGFTLGNCFTQRNLNAEGIAQAKRWKSYLAGKNITEARVYAGEWCRTMDTAKAMDVGRVETLPALSSFFQGHYEREHQTQGVRLFVNKLQHPQATILVTHQVNIQALVGVLTASNQGLILALPLTATPDILASVSPP